MKLRVWKYILLTFVISTLLSACSARKDEFISQFKMAYPDAEEDTAACVYNIASDSLEDEQYDLFITMILPGQKNKSKIEDSLGLMGSVKAMAKIAVVTGRLAKNCDWDDKPR